jgi:outer membrane protein OmpA-like peptidoglycan-associated protein
VNACARLLAIGAIALAFGCVGKPKVAPRSAAGVTLVALLPDPDTGLVGRAVVSNDAGTVELAAARASTVVLGHTAPAAVSTLGNDQVQQLFADAIDALPMPPRHFTLNFEFDSNELTGTSRALLVDVLAAVKAMRVPEVEVIGHTDTIGSKLNNAALGLRRAELIRRLLVDIGLGESLIKVTSHGEADLLIPTADGVAEPRNRRVEITVR